MKLNATFLRYMKACDDGLVWFIDTYGEEGEATEDELCEAITLYAAEINSDEPLKWIDWGMMRKTSSVVLKYWNKHSEHDEHKVINRLRKTEEIFPTFDECASYIKTIIQAEVKEMNLPIEEQSAAAKKIRKEFSIYCRITDEEGNEGWDLHIPT